ncbi:MAG: fatty-acyl-CoA synthase [Pseudonocardiales bacterium]|nr:fatty-acyl-CoA synthase [Pseudonocardiales bacterium]
MYTESTSALSHLAADRSEALVEITIGELLRQNAAAAPDRLALVEGTPDRGMRRTWTYAELLSTAETVAAALLARFHPGERIAVWAPNRAEWVLLQQGAALAGLVLVTVNPAYRAAELGYVLRQSRVSGIFHDGVYRDYDMAAAVAQHLGTLPDLREIVCFDDWATFLARADMGRPLPTVNPQDPAQIQYTSGTTGAAKGAVLHHRGVVNASRFVALRSDFRPGEVWVNAMPMFHVGGGVLTEIGAFSQRGTYVLTTEFEPALLLELIESYRGTITLLVPTMLNALLRHPDLAVRDMSGLRTVMSGSTVVPAALVDRVRTSLGCNLTIVFGQTELHGVITQTDVDDPPENQSTTIGRPLPQVEVKIVDPATGETLPRGHPGEICARGYQTMLGYFERPEESAATLDTAGWLHTGDIGEMDGRGYLTITGRLKDMIIRGGENVYPRELEDLLHTYPGIAEVAVIGIRDEHWGERVAAVVSPVDQLSPPDPRQLREHCRTHLAQYKAPTDWFFTRALPRTPTGKIQKFILRRRVETGELTPTLVAADSNGETSELDSGR